MSKSPYLEKNRLSEVISALQTMGLLDNYREDPEGWGYLISGRKSGCSWKVVFDQHPEFFRASATFANEYSLILRRASGQLFDRRSRKAITREERDLMQADDIKRYLSRAPITESQLKCLIDTAITLHKNAWDKRNDWRWWFAPTFSLIGAIGGSCLGVLLAAYLR